MDIPPRSDEYKGFARETFEELFQHLAPNGPWGKELARLTQRVAELFQQAATRGALR